MWRGDKRERDRRDIPVVAHLDELRGTILRCVAYVCVFAGAAWCFREQLLYVLQRPAVAGAKAAGIEHLPFRVFEPAGGFIIAIQVSIVAGIIASSPLIIGEIWRYLAPGFEEDELKHSIHILPFAIVLFAAGVVFCYFVSPNAFAFLFRVSMSLKVEPELTLLPYLWFTLRLMLAFGLAFELPLLMMFLGVIGLVTSRQLLAFWRHAVVIIFIFAAVVTPTPDPVNMTILAIPMVLLYLLSILLVHAMPQGRERPEEPAPETPPAAPVAEAELGALPPASETSEALAAPDDPTLPVYDEARARERETEEFYGEHGVATAPEEDVEIPTPDAGPNDADRSEGLPPV